jgi:hypothetical protein
MARRSARRDIGPPPGTTLLYDEFKALVLRQLLDAEALDRKLGIAIAALIATTGAVYAAHPAPIIGAPVASWLLVALVQAVRGFSYQDKFSDGPSASFYREREALDPEVIKWHALVLYEAAMQINADHLKQKGQRLTQVAATLGLVAAVGLVGKALGVA